MSVRPSAENDVHTIRYTDGTDDVLVTVPWGWHTGLIPPPTITFGSRTFLYAGDVIPPEVTA